MLKYYLGGAVGLVAFGQSAATQTGQQLLDQALSGDPSMGAILNEASKVATLGIQPTDAAIIVAGSGLAWKFLDTLSKSGTPETMNKWLARKLKVDGSDNPPPPPRA
jgi:hypothetical protein